MEHLTYFSGENSTFLNIKVVGSDKYNIAQGRFVQLQQQAMQLTILFAVPNINAELKSFSYAPASSSGASFLAW